MIATLEFSLPEDREEYDMCMKGSAYYALLTDIRDKIRGFEKYDSGMTFEQFIEWLRNETEYNELVA